MKKLAFIICLITWLVSCNSQNTSSQNTSEKTAAMKPEKNDDGVWDLQVIDTQYDYFLNAIAKPMNFYTAEFLKSRNSILVNEWNALYFSGRHRNVIESSIDYDPKENYGLKFEYKLYQVFAYVQWKYGLKINGLSMSEVR
ncbi:MAG: hypothetical protein KAY30_00260 [Cloacibacterium sp.]|nr:hypothetical protein [Cloacibacterium sp.]